MKLYIAFCNDRHIDAVIRVFSTPEKAIAFAKGFVEQWKRPRSTIDEAEIDGWLYHCSYGVEGDGVHVEETTLDAENEERDRT